MKSEEEELNRMLRQLRKSQPRLENTNDIEEEVIYRIRQIERKEEKHMNLLNYLFGWVYIAWVRKSLVTASVFLVIFFVYQQGVILKRINALGNQPVVNENLIMTGLRTTFDGNRFFLKIAGRKIKSDRNMVTEKQINEFLRSVEDLKDKYGDLIKLIDEDPELRKEIEKRMSGTNRKKFKI